MNNTLVPETVEAETFQHIEEVLGEHPFSPEVFSLVRAAIYATADFDFAKSIRVFPGAIEAGQKALRRGVPIITDSPMLCAGIDQKKLQSFGSEVFCFTGAGDVAKKARRASITHAVVSMRKAASYYPGAIYVIGDSATALLELLRLSGTAKPSLVIAAPLGFVAAVSSKERLAKTELPFITTLGPKGGAPVAAAMMNALIQDALEVVSAD